MDTKDYEMYTPEGNLAVGNIVSLSLAQRLSWYETYKLLEKLAQQPGRAEALDTAVREAVYTAIGAEERDESFYC